MSIFSDIVNKLFGKAKPGQPQPEVSPSPESTAAAPADAPAAQAAGGTTALADVDVEAVMDKLVGESGQTLNWRVSIVDMMKALGIDSSLEHRKALAHELKYGGDTNDSATMNVWLHKELMQALAAHGGKLPPELLG
ncbi:MAG TPA: DUF3597 domain-containing protein [Trinickia sp.]|jgi:hypothetical protein|uniref:DUF3597 domain-containing protein n=1 Tax=Trinickia sp. TaxID=2571163 RepID=UPI002BEBABED|nr:DUF3597 domain-containing protein [Trinickia sp.]HTI19132.1 DUF3597 domain-containing protein [Trinickia sp.]